MAEEISTCFQREMSGIQELNLGARYIFPERFRSRGNEERIVFAQIASKGGLAGRDATAGDQCAVCKSCKAIVCRVLR